MLKAIKPHHLSAYLRKIDKIFPEMSEANLLTADDITNYYNESYIGYSIFHSWNGAIHMAISRNGKFSKSDYFRQAEEAASLAKRQASSGLLLELGCGRGFNIGYLGHQLPDWTCVGVDFTERHINDATKRYDEVKNVRFNVDDFHELSSIEDKSCDIILGVESVCHALDLQKVAATVAKKIKPGGKLIIFDGFRSSEQSDNAELEQAATLAEAAMSVPKSPEVLAFCECFENVGFQLCENEDLSEAVMPNLVRLSDFAKGFFKFPALTKTLLHVFPRGLLRNAVAGILMPITVGSGIHSYRRLIFSYSE
ncbi:MAG: class I SAM-dependent methyltransferase [Chloracidobacterium sp.]|nr:class I SAM-dependent methyltransferase [Chloracidobacterium sp.]